MNGLEVIAGALVGVAELFEHDDIHSTTRFLLAATFSISSGVKWARPELAAVAMIDLRITRDYRPALGRALAALETALAVWLATGLLPKFSLGLAGLLLVAFCFVLAGPLLRRESVSCFCFGDADASLTWWGFARTAFLAIVAAVAAAHADAGEHHVATTRLAEVIAGVGVAAGGMLLARIPRLLRWNPTKAAT